MLQCKMKRYGSAQGIPSQNPFIGRGANRIMILNEDHHFLDEELGIGREAIAVRRVVSRAVLHIDVHADDDERVYVLVQDELIGNRSDTTKVEELLTVLTIEDGICHHVIVSGWQIDAQATFLLQEG